MASGATGLAGASLVGAGSASLSIILGMEKEKVRLSAAAATGDTSLSMPEAPRKPSPPLLGAAALPATRDAPDCALPRTGGAVDGAAGRAGSIRPESGSIVVEAAGADADAGSSGGAAVGGGGRGAEASGVDTNVWIGFLRGKRIIYFKKKTR
jgi:hypothetical protein